MRLFMAMAATYFEAAGNNQHRAAIEWFESQPPPTVCASDCQQRTVVTAFVPVNDKKGSESLGSTRSRQARTFPTVIPDSDVMYYIWDGEVPEAHVLALGEILTNVSRIGHSSSLVHAWLDRDFDIANAAALHAWTAGEEVLGGRPMRTHYSGALRELEIAYNGNAIELYADLIRQISEASGKAKSGLKKQLQKEFGDAVPTSRRPEPRLTARYHRADITPKLPALNSCFDDQLLVLAFQDGPVLGCESTLRVTTALRGAILSQFTSPAEIPEWISGHQLDGKPSQKTHLAMMPLPFIGAEHSDGHLLGIALAFPREVNPRARATGLRKLLSDPETGEDKEIVLRLGDLVIVTLRVESRSAAPLALRSRTWTGASMYWTSARPIVLDRFPKLDRNADRQGWLAETMEIVSTSCERIGLPAPADIAISMNSFLSGVPRAKPSGGGFPAYGNKNGASTRCMVHATIAFRQPVTGPVLLGAGRYLGYGLCKPFDPTRINHNRRNEGK
jgi:CRISPR-associated protein Csb2